MGTRSPADRWRGPDGQRLAGLVLARMSSLDSLADLALGEHEGRVDLRGFAVPQPEVIAEAYAAEAGPDGAATVLRQMSGLVEFRGIELANLDLSHSHLDHLRFDDAVLTDCLFDSARCRDWRAWHFTVERSSFRGADLRDSAIGTWQEQTGNSYRDVTFADADLRGIVCLAASFTDCDFSGVRLDQAEFNGCDFVRCKFAGPLDEVRFLADPGGIGGKTTAGVMREADFSQATLRLVEFGGYPMDDVVLPEESDAQVVVRHYPCVVRRALELLSEDFTPETRQLRTRLRTESGRLDEHRTVGVWHVDELGVDAEQQRFARQLLHRVERECSTTRK
jgi:uncharacterized protein YjbI with pentapeptide repeats